MHKPIKEQGLTLLETKICDNVWIGAKATILGGVIINSGAVVGAGAVVTKNVMENAVVTGGPAKNIKFRGEGGVQQYSIILPAQYKLPAASKKEVAV